MRRLGKVLHLSKSGNLLVRYEGTVSQALIGKEAYNAKLEKVGVVNNVLGPVRQPYLSLTPVADLALEKVERITLYLLDK